MTMHELKTKLSSSLNQLKGFCYNGVLCSGYKQVNESVIEFLQTNGIYVRVKIEDVTEIGTCKIYDERNGFKLPYADVVTKGENKVATRKAIFVGNGGTAPGEWDNGSCLWHDTKVYVHPLIDGISDALWEKIYNETNEYRPMFGKDGSKVYCDMDSYQIVRILNGKTIKIANITEVG